MKSKEFIITCRQTSRIVPAVFRYRMLITFFVLLVVSGVFCGSATADNPDVQTTQDLSDALNLTTDSGEGAAYVNGDGKVVLLQDVLLNYTINITALSRITLTANESNDFTIYRNFGNGYLFNVSSGTLILEGNNGHNLTVDGNKTTYDGSNGNSLIYVNGGEFNMSTGSVLQNSITSTRGGAVYMDSGMFNMTGGTISNNTATNFGGGVYVMTGGTFTMTGGTISNNTADNGGGVYVNWGTFNMNGGTISNNTANYGGGVYVYGGTFTLNGGTISNNTVNNGGGGVCVNVYGTFYMNGGTISGNTAYEGGGVYVRGEYVSSGTFTMTGGTISNNTATNFGGGVCAYGGTFMMNDGTISGNTAYEGGGVYVYYGTFTMNNGTISNNTATNNGGGVCVGGGTFTMNDGTISNNNVTYYYGGGVYVGGGTFDMNDGTISNNTANYGGGGVYVGGYRTFTMNGGTISNNTADNGGGVHINSAGTFTMTGDTTISNNTAENGGGVYVTNSGTFNMNGGTISTNTADNGGGVYDTNSDTLNMNGSAVINLDNDVYLATSTYINVAGTLGTEAGAKNITPAFTGIGDRVVEYGSVGIQNWASNFALNTTWALVNSRALTNTSSNLSLIENITVNFYLDEVSNVVYSAVTNLRLYDSISEPSTPAKPGNTFNGWNNTNASGTPWNFSTDTVSGYTKLYANWTVNPTPTPTPTPVPTSSGDGGNDDNNADYGPVSPNGTFTTNDGGLTLHYPAGSSIIVTVFKDYFNGAAAPSGVSYLTVYDVHSTADSGTSVTLVFRVKSSVLEEKGLTPEDISILHYFDREWHRMKITSIELINGEYQFTVFSDRTSPFMIAYDVDQSSFPLEAPEETSTPTSTPTTSPTQGEQTVIVPTTTSTEAASSPVPIIGIIAGLGILTLLIRRE